MSVKAIEHTDDRNASYLPLLDFQNLHNKEIKRQFRIIGSPRFSTRTIEGEVRSGYAYQTIGQGEWFVIPPAIDARLSFSLGSYNLNDLGEAITGRQKYERPSDNVLLMHERNIRFFRANWDKLFPLFYKTSSDSVGKVVGYGEVDLNDLKLPVNNVISLDYSRSCGKIDFLGFGPNGGVVMIDFAKSFSGKNKQLEKQRIGLTKLIGEYNRRRRKPNALPQINSFIGRYFDIDAEGCSAVELVPYGGQPLTIETSQEIVVFRIKKNGEIKVV